MDDMPVTRCIVLFLKLLKVISSDVTLLITELLELFIDGTFSFSELLITKISTLLIFDLDSLNGPAGSNNPFPNILLLSTSNISKNLSKAKC